jgi:hypothetical protein
MASLAITKLLSLGLLLLLPHCPRYMTFGRTVEKTLLLALLSSRHQETSTLRPMACTLPSNVRPRACTSQYSTQITNLLPWIEDAEYECNYCSTGYQLHAHWVVQEPFTVQPFKAGVNVQTDRQTQPKKGWIRNTNIRFMPSPPLQPITYNSVTCAICSHKKLVLIKVITIPFIAKPQIRATCYRCKGCLGVNALT